MGRGDPIDDPADEIRHRRPPTIRHAAEGPVEVGGLGNDVVGRSRDQLTERQDDRIEHVDRAGHRNLERQDDLGRDRDRVARVVWRRRVTAAALNGDEDVVTDPQAFA